ncbi:5-formyltetrahydrofolate cyclo-ligase [Clostridium sp. Cult3]|uniref:5-formyltetrahydrofolate cyclo-ligase n=1 Tax=Clostridium sp. Cult3 TaxID=2079004 RepID=UPI001F015FF2|nr:5-formyltetrahydrofolate cyclo-ligase [Clostridium sp. Cult3]
MDKKVLRKQILDKRSQLTPQEIKEKSKSIENRLFSLVEYKQSNFIFSFISFRDEVHTHEIIKTSLDNGKRIGVPITVVEPRKLLVSEIKDFDEELEMGYYDILAPKEEYQRIVSPDLVDLVLVPGVAFDERGYRVGYGGGYYDRFFSGLKRDVVKIGLCYELQISSQVPIDSYDIPVDYILTERRLIKCRNKNT